MLDLSTHRSGGHCTGTLKIRWYGLSISRVLSASWILLRRRAKQRRWAFDAKHVEDIIFYGVLGVIVGGRLGSMLFYNFDDLLADPRNLYRIWEGGMSFHGGLLGVLVAMWLFARKHGFGFWQVVDFVAPVVPLGLGSGRIGNFINGELWGKVSDVPWAFVVNGQARHATQLYEAFLEGLVMFIVLWTVFFAAATRDGGFGPVRCAVRRVPICGGVSTPARRPYRLSCLRLADHGPAAVTAAVAGGSSLLLYLAYSKKDPNEAVS